MTNSNLKTHDPNLPFPPPWRLTGSAALILSRRGAVTLVHYESAPVGPYDEWARSVLTLRGPRVVKMLVTSSNSMRAGRQNWGFPKQLANLQWQQLGPRIVFSGSRQTYRLRAWGPRFPLRANLFCVQTLNGQDVIVPLSLQGRARLAWRGRQAALLIEDFVFDVDWPK